MQGLAAQAAVEHGADEPPAGQQAGEVPQAQGRAGQVVQHPEGVDQLVAPRGRLEGPGLQQIGLTETDIPQPQGPGTLTGPLDGPRIDIDPGELAVGLAPGGLDQAQAAAAARLQDLGSAPLPPMGMELTQQLPDPQSLSIQGQAGGIGITRIEGLHGLGNAIQA